MKYNNKFNYFQLFTTGAKLTYFVCFILVGAAVLMPPVRHIRRAIMRIRQRIQAPVPLPADRSSLVLHDEFRKLLNG